MSPSITYPQTLRVLLFQERAGEDKVWIAQCLEHDIAAQGDTISEAQKSFERTFRGEIVLALERGKTPLSGIAPAPSLYLALWEDAHQLTDSMSVTPDSVTGRSQDLVTRAEAEFRVAA